LALLLEEEKKFTPLDGIIFLWH